MLVRKLSTAESRVGLLGKNLSGDRKDPAELELANAFNDGRRRNLLIRELIRGIVDIERALFSVSDGPSYWPTVAVGLLGFYGHSP